MRVAEVIYFLAGPHPRSLMPLHATLGNALRAGMAAGAFAHSAAAC